MDYALHKDRPLTDEVRRVLGELVDDCVTRSTSAHREDVHEEVHEVRKSLKRARAVVALIRRHASDADQLNDRLRDIARTLSAVRDDAAVVEGFEVLRDALAERVAPDVIAELGAALHARRDASTSAAAATLHAAARDLAALGPLVADVSLDVADPGALSRGLRRAARRSQAAAAAAVPGHDPEAFHEWRKRAKRHRYQLELLAGESDPGFADLLALTDLLGEIQDMTVLLARIADDVDFIRVGAALVGMRYEREVTAVSAGARLFGLAPSAPS